MMGLPPEAMALLGGAGGEMSPEAKESIRKMISDYLGVDLVTMSQKIDVIYYVIMAEAKAKGISLAPPKEIKK